MMNWGDEHFEIALLFIIHQSSFIVVCSSLPNLDRLPLPRHQLAERRLSSEGRHYLIFEIHRIPKNRVSQKHRPLAPFPSREPEPAHYQPQIVREQVAHQLLGYLDIDYHVSKDLDARFLFSNREHANVDKRRAFLQHERVIHHFDIDLAKQRVQVVACLFVGSLMSFGFEFHSVSRWKFRGQPSGGRSKNWQAKACTLNSNSELNSDSY